MTERDLHHLLTEAAGDPPRPLDPDDLLRTAGRRRTARAGALVGGLGVAGVAVALLIPTLTPRTPQVAVPAATPTASAPGTASPTPQSVVCPTASPPDNSIRDWADVLVWGGYDYSGRFTDDPVEVGEQVGVVTCNIQVISNDGHSDVPRPWPDGTATFVPVGTPLLTVAGQDPRCYLAARFGGQLSVFRAWEPYDPANPTPVPRKGCEPLPASTMEPVSPAPQPSGTAGPPKTQPVEPKR